MATKTIVHACTIILAVLAVSDCASRRYTAYNDFATPVVSETFEDPTRITIGNETNFGPTLSPNGAYMFYTSDRAGNKDLFVKKTRGGYPSQLTTHPADDFSPVLSPDGQKIAFISRRDNALGAIHILDLRQTVSKITGSIDSTTVKIDLKNVELRHPAWFPDSRSLVFSGRQPGSKTSQLYTATADDDNKPAPIVSAHGEQPSVNRSGNQITYSRQGRIYLFDLVAKIESPLTAGLLVQDGHPKFGNTDDEILFIRYADDTNFDNQIDATDRPSIWSLTVSHQIASQNNLENLRLKPLTSAKFGAYYPSSYGPYLYFSSQQDETLDVFKLPINGHTRDHHSLEETEQNFQRLTDDDDKVYLLRHDAAMAERLGDSSLAISITLKELAWLIELGRATEAQWLSEKLMSIRNMTARMQVMVKILAIEVALLPWLDENSDIDLTEEDRQRLNGLEDELNDVLKNTTNSDAEISGLARFVLAQIHAATGRRKTAEQMLTSLASSEAYDHKIGARALQYRAQLEASRGDQEKSLATSISLMNQHPEDQTRIRNLAIDITSNISKADPKAISKLQSLVKRSAQAPQLRMRAHYRIAEIYREQDNPEAAMAHFDAIIKDINHDTELGFKAVAEILSFHESSGQYTAAQSLLTTVKSGRNDNSETLHLLNKLTADFHTRKASSHMINGDIDLAVLEYRQALSLDPENLDAREGLLDAQIANLSGEKALDDIERKLSTNKNDPDTAYLLAHTLIAMPSQERDNRVKALNRSIELLQDARQVNGQEPRYHGLLAKLYLEKAQLSNIRSNPNSISGRLGLARLQFKSMFGFGDPNWLELALDSYLTAYQMTPDRTLIKAKLATQIADIYFSNENYHLSLRYYLKRIQFQSDALRQTPREDMLLFRHAGRAAFYTDELRIAETMQLRALREAEKTGQDLDIAYSLDALALTYREQKQFDRAIANYQKLAEIHTKLRQEENLAGTFINLGYCNFMKSNHALALDHYRRAEQILDRFKEKIGKEPDDAIKIDIAGQNSAALGFSTLDRLIQIATFRAMIFQALGQLREAATHIEKKRTLLEAKVNQHKKLGLGAGYLAEERSIAVNNLGWLQHSLGQLDESSMSFARARQLATHLRVKNQTMPSRAEWLNLLNQARVELQRQNINNQTKDQREAIEKDLKKTIDDLEPHIAQGQKEPTIAGAALKSVYAQILSFGAGDSDQRFQTGQKLYQESILLGEKVGLSPKSNGNANLNLDHTAIEGDTHNSIIESQYDFRRTALVSPKIAWKYYATRGLYQQALTSLTEYVENAGTLKDHEISLMIRCVEQLLQTQKLEVRQDFDALRQYFFIKIQAMATQAKESRSAPTVAPQSLGRIERITAVLEEDDALLTLYETKSGLIHGVLLNSGKFTSLRINAGEGTSIFSAALKTADQPNNRSANLKRIYVAANSASLILRLTKEKTNALDIAYIASPDTLPKMHNARPVGLVPALHPIGDLPKFVTEELDRRAINNDFSPVIFTNLDLKKIDAESAFVDQPISQALNSIDNSAVLIGYLGPSKKQIDAAVLARARNAATEAYRNGKFEIAKQRAIESLGYATLLKNDELTYQAATIAIDSSLKLGIVSGLARLKQIQISASKVLGKKADSTAELDSAALAIQHGHLMEARVILNSYTPRVGRESATKNQARYLFLLASLPDQTTEDRLNRLRESLKIYTKFSDFHGMAIVEESIAAILSTQSADARSVLNHLITARAYFSRKDHFEDVLRVNLRIAQIWNEIGEPDNAIKILSPIATTSGATRTNESALNVLIGLADGHCIELESAGCRWAKDSLFAFSRRVRDERISRRAASVASIAEAHRLARIDNFTGAENILNEQILRIAGQSEEDEISLRMSLAKILRYKGDLGASDRELNLTAAIALKMDPDKSQNLFLTPIVLDQALNALHRGDRAEAIKLVDDVRTNKVFKTDRFQQMTGSLIAAESFAKSGNLASALAEAEKALEASRNTWRPEAKWRVASMMASLNPDQGDRISTLEKALDDARMSASKALPILSTHHFADAQMRTIEGLYLEELAKAQNPTEAFKTLAISLGDTRHQKLDLLQTNMATDQALIIAAAFDTGTSFVYVDRERTIFEHLPQKNARSVTQFPSSIAQHLKSIRQLALMTDPKTRSVPFAAMTIDGIPLIATTDIHYIDAITDLEKASDNRNGRKSPSIVGVVIPPTTESMVKKTSKILSRYYPDSHLLDSKKITAKSLNRDFPGHDVQIISLPKVGGYQSFVPTKFRLPGETPQPNQQITLATPELFSSPKMRAQLSILPQPNQAIDMLKGLRQSGSEAVLVNFGTGDQDIDTFVFKNFLKHHKAGLNVCSALRRAQQAAIRYYPGLMDWANFRIYGNCIE